jgi:hypothetical protein
MAQAAALQAALAAATAAAQAATTALTELKQTKASGLVSKPKELELSGKPEEDRRTWQDWKFAAVQYLSVRDQKFVENINQVVARTDPVEMDALSPDEKNRSEALYVFLSGLVKGRLLGILKNPRLAANSNGFEALRLIQHEIEPASGAAAIGLLETILSIPEPPRGTPLRDSILAVERLFEDYEASSKEKLGENLKIATLRKLLPAELKVHATLLVKEGVTYEQVKKAVAEYEVADRSFQALKPEAIYSGAIPMEVDAIQATGKGKGGKGDKPQCKHCGKSHRGECWAKGQQGSKGKGKGGKDAKGKSKGDSQKGKTQQPPKEPCQICGKAGHGAAKCFQRFKQDKGKVQQTKDSVPSGTGEAPSPKGNGVAAIGLRDGSTSPEAELARTTLGITSANRYGQARCLLDTGADEHICPESFASWIPAKPKATGPRLKDAQGNDIPHESKYRTVGLCHKNQDGRETVAYVCFWLAQSSNLS